jgi:transcriptional regulator with XRE-family HTH domain
MINPEMLDDAVGFLSSEEVCLKEDLEVETILAEIASKFLKYRNALNMSQKDFAVKLGITQAMVSKLESGEYNPSVRFLAEISRKLHWDFRVELRTAADEPDYRYTNVEDGKKLPAMPDFIGNSELSS